MSTLTGAEILQSLDLAAVEAKILLDDKGEPCLLAHDFEDAKLMCWAAAEKWLPTDLETLHADTLQLEQPFNLTLDGYPTRGIFDLTAQYSLRDREGQRLIADWKSTDGELDKIWEGRLVSSTQWQLYSVVPPGADWVSYRGVNPKGKTREIYIDVRSMPNLHAGVSKYFGGVGDMQKALASRDVWPMNKPSACGAYGQTCVFKTDCDNGTAPQYLLPASDIQLSYSGAQRFLQCPEKYRRIKTAPAGSDSSDTSRRGVAMHRGLEEIYRQSFQKYGK